MAIPSTVSPTRLTSAVDQLKLKNAFYYFKRKTLEKSGRTDRTVDRSFAG